MNNKLFFRILGALASSLIIVSVFVPYISMTGYTESLWNNYQALNSIYLPIMIIVFGVIGVLFFSLNIKTEFAYMSTGAILFFLVMQTISFINQGAFNTLSLGYYFLVIGAVITGLMAFLCNLRIKVKKELVQSESINNETNMLEQIDKLYNDQQIQETAQVIQPIEVQPIQTIEPVQQIEQVEPIPEQEIFQPQNIVNEQANTQQVQLQSAVEQNNVPVQPMQPVNPVVQEFMQSQPEVQQNNIPVQSVQPVNPVVQDFAVNTNTPSQPMQQIQPQGEQKTNPVVQEFTQPQQPVNPVVQDFMNPSATPSVNNIPNTNNSGVDIFGQPINK